MMRQYSALPQALREVMRDPLCEPARVHENQRRAMRQNQVREPVVSLRPHFVTRHRSEFIFRNFNREIQFSAMPAIQDAELFVWVDKTRHFFNRPYRRG